MECPCYSEFKDCVPGFEKIIDLKNVGLVVYRHTTHIEDVNTETGNIENAVNTTEDIYILHNATDTDLSSVAYWPEIEQHITKHPRCWKINEHAQQLLKSGPTIRGNNVKGICDHCKMKDASCYKCQKLAKKCISGKPGLTYITEERVKRCLKRIKLLLEDARTSKTKNGSHSDIRIDQLCRDFKSSVHEPEVQKLFEPHKLHSATFMRPSIDNTKVVHFPKLEKLESPTVSKDPQKKGEMSSSASEYLYLNEDLEVVYNNKFFKTMLHTQPEEAKRNTTNKITPPKNRDVVVQEEPIVDFEHIFKHTIPDTSAAKRVKTSTYKNYGDTTQGCGYDETIDTKSIKTKHGLKTVNDGIEKKSNVLDEQAAKEIYLKTVILPDANGRFLKENNHNQKTALHVTKKDFHDSWQRNNNSAETLVTIANVKNETKDHLNPANRIIFPRKPQNENLTEQNSSSQLTISASDKLLFKANEDKNIAKDEKKANHHNDIGTKNTVSGKTTNTRTEVETLKKLSGTVRKGQEALNAAKDAQSLKAEKDDQKVALKDEIGAPKTALIKKKNAEKGGLNAENAQKVEKGVYKAEDVMKSDKNIHQTKNIARQSENKFQTADKNALEAQIAEAHAQQAEKGEKTEQNDHKAIQRGEKYAQQPKKSAIKDARAVKEDSQKDTQTINKYKLKGGQMPQQAQKTSKNNAQAAEKVTLDTLNPEIDARKSALKTDKSTEKAGKLAYKAEKNTKNSEKNIQQGQKTEKDSQIAEKHAQEAKKNKNTEKKAVHNAEIDSRHAANNAPIGARNTEKLRLKTAVITEEHTQQAEKSNKNTSKATRNGDEKFIRQAENNTIIGNKNADIFTEKHPPIAKKHVQQAEKAKNTNKNDPKAPQNTGNDAEQKKFTKDAQIEQASQKANKYLQKGRKIPQQAENENDRRTEHTEQKAKEITKTTRIPEKATHKDVETVRISDKSSQKTTEIFRNAKHVNQSFFKSAEGQKAEQEHLKEAKKNKENVDSFTERTKKQNKNDNDNDNNMIEKKKLSYTNINKIKLSQQEKTEDESKTDKRKIKEVHPSLEDLISKLVKLKQLASEGILQHTSSELRLTENYIKEHCNQHTHRKNEHCLLCANSDIELECASLCHDNEIKDEHIIIGPRIFKFTPPRKQFQDLSEITENEKDKEYNGECARIPDADGAAVAAGKKSGHWLYSLSDRKYIENGWTQLPTEKVMRRMNVYRMRPAHPEFDWFEHNKEKRLMHYDTGEKLAEFDDNGRGRWYYRNGRVALVYYDTEGILNHNCNFTEQNAGQRFVVYSNGEPDERGRSRPYTLLATFDYLGDGIVFDHGGKIRLKYNQTEGVVLDRSIGPVSHWKWHTLNDPPVLQQVMINTFIPHKDPEIMKMGNPGEDKPRQDDEEMLAVEYDNIVKEKSKKLSQVFTPFQIKMKALKINEHFSLKVLDQATVYLLYRDGTTHLKLNIGMVLDSKEIVDTDKAEVGDVSNILEKLPARTESLENLQKSIAIAQQYDRMRTKHERKLHPGETNASVDKLVAGISRPLPQLLTTVPSGMPLTSTAEHCKWHRKPTATNVYYDTRLC